MAPRIDLNTQDSFKRKFFPIYYFLASYPRTTVIMIVSLIVAGLAEGLGLAAILPLINIAVDTTIDTSSVIGRTVVGFFNLVKVKPSLGHILSIIVGLMLLKAILVFWSLRTVGYIGARVVADLRGALSKALSNANWLYFVKKKTGDISTAVGIEPERAAQTYPATGRIISEVIQVGTYAFVATTISPWVTVSAFVFGGLMMWGLRSLVRIAREASKKQTKFQRIFMSLFIDCLGSMKPLKAMGRQEQFVKLINSDIEMLYEVRKKAIFSGVALKSFQEPLQIIAIAIGLFFLMDYWKGSLDSLLILVFLFYRMSQKLGSLLKYYQSLVSCLPAFWFIYETIDEAEKEKELSQGKKDPVFERRITLDHVSFSYGRKMIFQNISLEIEFGKFIAIIGDSGSGKTTIVDMIIGLNKPIGGTIKLDEISLAEIDLNKWRRSIGYVPQETVLFHDSILRNVTFGDQEITETQVETALQKAGAWDFVKCLPEGIHESVGEHGARFSGGQRQRIAIARALVNNPLLLILDESTTALDEVTEAGIIETLNQLKGEMTIFAISHQPAMKKASDIVYCIEDGNAWVLNRDDQTAPCGELRC
jgi:ATP-binding cassette, subfamily C, bacterial